MSLELVAVMVKAHAELHAAASELASITGKYASEVSDLRGCVWGYTLIGRRHVLHVLHGGSPEYITSLGDEPAHIEGDVCGVVQPGYEAPSTLHLFTTSMRDDCAVRLAVDAHETAVASAEMEAP